MKNTLIILTALVILTIVSCGKDDLYNKETQGNDSFSPLPVRDLNSGVYYNLMTGEKIDLKQTKDEVPVRWREGWVAVNDGTGWVVVGSYMRWLYTPSSTQPLDCYLPMRNCLPTVSISSGIKSNEDPNGGNFDFEMEPVTAQFILSEYGEALNQAVDDDLVIYNYFNAYSGSESGLSIHSFINFNDLVQSQIIDEVITFKRFNDNICVVYIDATESNDCPSYFFDDDYNVQSN